VKIRGYRIESAEIEGRLVNHEGINETVVIARENEEGNKFLCAFYVKAEGTEKTADLDVSSLREFLSADLPDYMIPSYFIPLEQIPLTPNKKIDRKALLKYDIVRPQGSAKYLAPQTELEERIADCWKKVLQLDQVGIHDNFFDLGGSSMEIIQLANELKPVLGTDITVVSLFRHLTIGSFARYLMEQTSAAQPSPRAAHNQESQRRAKNIFKNTVKKTLRGRHV
jgi:aryl carrier-like protein